MRFEAKFHPKVYLVRFKIKHVLVGILGCLTLLLMTLAYVNDATKRSMHDYGCRIHFAALLLYCYVLCCVA